MTDISRRAFVAGAAACAVAAPSVSIALAAPAAEVLQTEVLVVGVGAAGFQAALGAAQLGAQVTAIDLAPNMLATTNTTTSGYLCVGDKLQLAQPFHFEVPEIYTLMNQLSNYCYNTQVLNALLEASSRSSNNLIDNGILVKDIEMPERCELTGPTLGQRCGHPYAIAGQERADAFENALLANGVQIIYSCEAK